MASTADSPTSPARKSGSSCSDGGNGSASSPTTSPIRPSGPARKRSTSGSLLSRIPFIRSSGSDHHRSRSRHSTDENERPVLPEEPNSAPPQPTIPSIPDVVPEVPYAPDDSPPHFQPLHRRPYLPPITTQPSYPESQHHNPKTRRRRGSLRKVALLGRGAQREKRDARTLSIDTTKIPQEGANGVIQKGGTVSFSPLPLAETDTNIITGLKDGSDAFGLGISDITPRPSMDGYASRSAAAAAAAAALADDMTPRAPTAPIIIPRTSMDAGGTDSTVTSPTISYSTTDDEDSGGLHMAGPGSRPTTPSASSSSASLVRPERASLSSGSEGYFPTIGGGNHARISSSGGTTSSMIGSAGIGASNGGLSSNGGSISGGGGSLQRRRSATQQQQRAKSPLALHSLALSSSGPLAGGGKVVAGSALVHAEDAWGAAAEEWDYQETEFWGWVVLCVTWVVFVTGMGSCLGVWSWAWDVGKTPEAPPELSDDDSLPVVGYYPAVIILNAVMAWVWVVVAWVGMKYFRHARVNGD